MNSNLIAFILAAGLGSRLKPYTDNMPKPCLKLKQGVSIIGNIINQINDYDWINQYVINTHYLPHKVMEEAIKYTNKNIIFTYEPNILGTAGAIENVEKLIHDRDDVLIIYGDLYLKIDFEKYYNLFTQQKYGCLILLGKIKNEQEYLSKGIVEFENNRITKFIEKPSNLDNYKGDHYYNSGIYFINSTCLKYILCFGSDFGRDVFPEMIRRNNELNCAVIDDDEFVIDIGTIDKYGGYCQ